MFLEFLLFAGHTEQAGDDNAQVSDSWNHVRRILYMILCDLKNISRIDPH